MIKYKNIMKNSKGFAALQALKTEMEIKRNEEELCCHNEMNKRYQERMEKRGFRSPEEMIDYLISGKKIVDDTGQSFRFIDGDVGAVEFVYEVYDECVGPQGFGKKYKTLDDFEDFVYTLEKHRKYNGDKWLPVWIKDI